MADSDPPMLIPSSSPPPEQEISQGHPSQDDHPHVSSQELPASQPTYSTTRKLAIPVPPPGEPGARPGTSGGRLEHESSHAMLIASHNRVANGSRYVTISNSYPTNIESTMTMANFRDDVFELLKCRLVQAGISTYSLDKSTMQWILPQKHEDAADWRMLLNNPLRVPPSVVERLLSLRSSTPYSAVPQEDTTVFYIRTFVYTVNQLRDIIEKVMEMERGYHPRTNYWLQIMTELKESVEKENRADDQSTDRDWRNIPLYIRYCGMTTGRRAWDRHAQDMSHDSHLGWRVLQLTRHQYPEIIENALIQEVPRATVPFAGAQDQKNIREQLLIALLGESTLNVERGGQGSTYEPTLEDRNLFRELGTHNVKRMAESLRPCSADTRDAMQQWANEMVQYANSHSVTTGLTEFSLTNEIADVRANEASPAHLSDLYAPLFFVGHDFGVHPHHPWYLILKMFFEGAVTSSALAAQVINYFGSWEESNLFLDESIARTMLSQGHLPFADLFPWPRASKEDTPEAIRMLRKCLQAANPLVALLFGGHVSSIGMSGFSHEFGIRYQEYGFSDFVGKLHLTTYQDPDEEFVDDDSILIIPCFHPGAWRYGGYSQPLVSRVFTLTIAIAWLATHESLLLEQQAKELPKSELLKKIKQAVEHKTGPNTKFGQVFEDLKKKLKAEHAVRHRHHTLTRLVIQPGTKMLTQVEATLDHRLEEWKENYTSAHGTNRGGGHIKLSEVAVEPVSNKLRWARGRDELVMLLMSGFAQDHPNSQKRRAQVKKLYNKRIAPLLSIKGNEEDSFSKWAELVPESENYYFAAATFEDQMEDIPNLLSIFAKLEIVADLTKEQAKIGSTALSKWLKKHVKPGIDTQRQELEMLQKADVDWLELMQDMDKDRVKELKAYLGSPKHPPPEVLDAKKFLNGSQVSVQPHARGFRTGVLNLNWVDTEGNNIVLKDLEVPVSTFPMYEGDLRFIYFTPEGIDIRNRFDVSLGLHTAGIGKAVTLPVNTIAIKLEGNKHKDDVRKLWEQQTGKDFAATLDSMSGVEQGLEYSGERIIPYSFFKDSRSEPFRTNYSTDGQLKKAGEHVQSLLPFQPGDALWLLDRFMTENYPEGGKVEVSSPAVFKDADTLWTKLIKFCVRPMYSKHPQVQHLKAICIEAMQDATYHKNSVVFLHAGLEKLRPPVEKSRSKKETVETLKGIDRTYRTYLTVGASAPLDVIQAVEVPLVEQREEPWPVKVGAEPVEWEEDIFGYVEGDSEDDGDDTGGKGGKGNDDKDDDDDDDDEGDSDGDDGDFGMPEASQPPPEPAPTSTRGRASRGRPRGRPRGRARGSRRSGSRGSPPGGRNTGGTGSKRRRDDDDDDDQHEGNLRSRLRSARSQ